MRTLRDRVAVVTGAAHGIGRALAERLRQSGCRLALVDLDARALAAAGEQLAAAGAAVSTHVLDVADRAAMLDLPAAVLERHGAVHLLVNNAGVSVAGPVAETSLDDYAWIVGVNFWGTIYGCKAMLPHLLAADEGHIVTVCSDFGLVGFPTKSGYCATKFAIRGFCEALAAELHGTQVGLSLIYPPAVATDIVDRGRVVNRHKQALESAFLKRRGMAAERDAARIVRAIERNQRRVVIGPEMHAIDLLSRFSPRATQWLLPRVARRMPFV
ncbi:MAG: SDR family NAD(P)-dependent oxidoreductase [Pirellulales bacterium]|nr:SDR family NAD(P)-dependent oxidoreductase [Pirellulales bacterium]